LRVSEYKVEIVSCEHRLRLQLNRGEKHSLHASGRLEKRLRRRRMRRQGKIGRCRRGHAEQLLRLLNGGELLSELREVSELRGQQRLLLLLLLPLLLLQLLQL